MEGVRKNKINKKEKIHNEKKIHMKMKNDSRCYKDVCYMIKGFAFIKNSSKNIISKNSDIKIAT